MKTAPVLGLDLGTNSVGWALIDHRLGENGELADPIRLIDAGVRIFQEGVEANRNESRNVARRMARAARRQHQRRNQRRDALRDCLRRAGMLPGDRRELEILLRENPYVLRARGLDEPLTAHQFGRALYHLAQRRGFKSSRKAEHKADKKESRGVREGITQLAAEIEQSGSRTLGEYLSAADPRQKRVRGRYTSREMYEQEFDALWRAQVAHHTELLSDPLRDRVRRIIFSQRPLKVQKHLVGECELEPGKKRSPRATWYAQQFRILQDVNHLEFPDLATGEVRKLNADERQKLVASLQTRKEMTFDQIRKLLGLLESQRFNFEEANHRDKLKGNTTEWTLRRFLKESYDKLPTAARDEIVRDLLFAEDPAVIRRHAAEKWGLDAEAAEALSQRELESGYLHLSEKAIKRLLPELEKGHSYMEAVEAAGYQRRDQRDVRVGNALGRGDLPQLRNPIVMAAMHQMRRVVNAIVRAYDKPARIRVEMARDLKVSLAKRAEILREKKENRRLNEAALKCLEEDFGLSNPTREDLIKYKLWRECGTCVYTGKVISKEAIFSGEWDVEHILPLPRSGDNSFMNKTLCFAEENRKVKRNRMPWEAYGADGRRWDELTLRIQRLPWPKRRRFLMKEIREDFISRQLNDTRYIAREARSYLETLAGKNNVQIGKGAITAELRRRWGLNGILSASGEKTREDHRHHAVDAVAIALTTPAAVKRMSEIEAAHQRREDGFPPPWPGFRDEVKRRVESIVVSHRVLREVRGALHQETNYGILGVRDEKGQDLYAVRKRLEGLSANELSRIADPRVKEIVLEHLRRHGADPEDDKSAAWKKAMSADNPPLLPNRNGNPVPIRKVRLHKPLSNVVLMKNKRGEVYRAVDSGSNHHVVIFENTDGKNRGRWEAEFLSTFEAARRARSGQPLIRRDLGDGRRFVMSLSINEMVRFEADGVAQYWRVQKLDAGGRRITLRLHTAANINDSATSRTLMFEPLRKLNPVKVTIDPLGREHPAND